MPSTLQSTHGECVYDTVFLICASNWNLQILEVTQLCSPQEFLNFVLGFNDPVYNSINPINIPDHLTAHLFSVSCTQP